MSPEGEVSLLMGQSTDSEVFEAVSTATEQACHELEIRQVYDRRYGL